MSKRAQVTLFVIIAIIIVAISLVIFLTTTNKTQKVNNENNVIKIKSYISTCFKDSSEKVILETGKKSGYYNKSNLSTGEGIAFYFIENKSFVPELTFILNQTETGFDKEFKRCLNNFSAFKQGSLELFYSEPENKVVLKNDIFNFSTYFSLKIKEKQSTSVVNYSNQVIFKIKFLKIYSIVKKVVDQQTKSDYIYLSQISDLSNQSESNRLNFTATIQNSLIIFNISQEDFKINNETYSFLFAGKY